MARGSEWVFCGFPLCLSDGLGLQLLLASLGLRHILVQRGDLGQAGRVLVSNRPLAEEDIALLAHRFVNHGVSCHDAKALEKCLVSKGLLKPGSSIID